MEVLEVEVLENQGYFIWLMVTLVFVVCGSDDGRGWNSGGVILDGWWWCDPGCNTVRSWLEHCEILNVTFLHCHSVTVSQFIFTCVLSRSHFLS